ncbi:hypothetical protein D3C72_2587120 [compost metagenome]
MPETVLIRIEAEDLKIIAQIAGVQEQEALVYPLFRFGSRDFRLANTITVVAGIEQRS